MLQSEVINKLSKELCLAQGSFDHFQNNRIYIQMALSIGVEHYTKDMEEVVAMDRNGVACGRYKGVTDAAKELGVRQSDISAVLTGTQHSTGGFLFMKVKDYELVPREKPENPIYIIPLK